jgi:hypothetical protein
MPKDTRRECYLRLIQHLHDQLEAFYRTCPEKLAEEWCQKEIARTLDVLDGILKILDEYAIERK